MNLEFLQLGSECVHQSLLAEPHTLKTTQTDSQLISASSTAAAVVESRQRIEESGTAKSELKWANQSLLAELETLKTTQMEKLEPMQCRPHNYDFIIQKEILN